MSDAQTLKKDYGINADVRMISGCDDSQTSADVSSSASGAFKLPADVGKGASGGACTFSIVESLHESSSHTWITLLDSMRKKLKSRGYKQIPQLSSSKDINLKEKFSLLNQGVDATTSSLSATGKKKALLIGINYIGQQGELGGCHNDVKMIQKTISKLGFGDDTSFKILMDDSTNTPPTKANILNAFKWLVQDAKEGDSLFMHYSGHGGQEKDRSNDEKDGMDETIVPVDYLTAGQVLDDEIYKNLVVPLPKGVKLFMIMDCCHSGSIVDLPLIFKADEQHMIDAANGVATMEPNPKFNMERVIEIGKKLLMMHQSGASATEIAMTAARDLSESEGFFEEMKKLFQMCCGMR